eukprot:TRINITY_DN8910_c0_g1_i1.p1 TRINITY_DN8910_c0_g1~~TRINITY_DN8910_c0_g1_i1.p1  ORF type:complete len:276 (-),score=16.88 TRINITY_DN8910_c0_g1_i1:175-1002(-)
MGKKRKAPKGRRAQQADAQAQKRRRTTGVFVSTSNFLTASCSQAPLALGPYNNKQYILVVGDGNLSFSNALACSLGGERICGTVYDSEQDFRQKYPSAHRTPRKLREMNATVLFGVNARKLHWHEDLCAREFDRVVFNFPHTGASSAEGNIETNQELLKEFFCSARTLLARSGQIHVTLRTTTFYNAWDIEGLGKSCGLRVLRCYSHPLGHSGRAMNSCVHPRRHVILLLCSSFGVLWSGIFASFLRMQMIAGPSRSMRVCMLDTKIAVRSRKSL